MNSGVIIVPVPILHGTEKDPWWAWLIVFICFIAAVSAFAVLLSDIWKDRKKK